MRAEIWTYKVVGHIYKHGRPTEEIQLLELKASHEARINMSYIGKMLETIKSTKGNLVVVKPKMYDNFLRVVVGNMLDPDSVKLRADICNVTEEHIVVIQ